jgi:hypothetical protein
VRSFLELAEIIFHEPTGESLLDAVEEVFDLFGDDKVGNLLRIRDESTEPFRRVAMSQDTQTLSVQERLDTLQELLQELTPDEIDILINQHMGEIAKLKRMRTLLVGRRRQAPGKVGEKVIQLFKSTGNKPLHLEQIALKLDLKANKCQMAINKARQLFVKNQDGWKLSTASPDS